MHTHPRYREIALVYRALGNERRLFLLQCLLNHGSMTEEEICSVLQIRPPAVSRHLHVLLRTGFLRSQRNGMTVKFWVREGLDVHRILERKNLFAKWLKGS